MNIYESNIYISDIKRVAENNDFKKFRNKKIFITGASGLICSFLIDVLEYRNEKFGDNIQIYMLCRNEEKIKKRFCKYSLEKLDKKNNVNLIYIVQDVCDKFDFDIEFDFIIHAASNTHPRLYSCDPVGTITTNVIGMNNILNYSIKHKPERIFMMSSVEIYGENKGDIEFFDEKYLGYLDCNTVRAGYPESKRLCEALCQAYILQYGLDIVIGRLSRVYGPTMLSDDSKALAQFIRNAVNNEDIVLKSDGNQYYSYMYMADAVTAILSVLNNGENGEAYNISDELSNIKLKELAGILAELSNKKVVYELPDEIEKKGYSSATKAVMNSDKIKKIGWKPFYDIRKGLINTVNILKSM